MGDRFAVEQPVGLCERSPMVNARGWLVVAIWTAAMLSVSVASNFPCPSKGQSCARVKAAVAMFGEDAVEGHARACGWTDREIEQARRCLRK